MITSQEKIEDMKIRQTLLDITESCMRLGLTEHAKDIGEVSKKLGETIKTKDYSKDESFDWEKKVNEGCDRQGIPRIYPKTGDSKPHPLPEGLE